MPTKSSSKQNQKQSVCKSSTKKSCGKESKNNVSSNNSCCEFASDKCCLNDKEIISDVLGNQKALVKLYSSALCEASCTQLRDLIGEHISECAIDQYDSFLYMNERGMYPTDNATAPKINQAQKKFAKLEQNMK